MKSKYFIALIDRIVEAEINLSYQQKRINGHCHEIKELREVNEELKKMLLIKDQEIKELQGPK